MILTVIGLECFDHAAEKRGEPVWDAPFIPWPQVTFLVAECIKRNVHLSCKASVEHPTFTRIKEVLRILYLHYASRDLQQEREKSGKRWKTRFMRTFSEFKMPLLWGTVMTDLSPCVTSPCSIIDCSLSRSFWMLIGVFLSFCFKMLFNFLFF